MRCVAALVRRAAPQSGSRRQSGSHRLLAGGRTVWQRPAPSTRSGCRSRLPNAGVTCAGWAVHSHDRGAGVPRQDTITESQSAPASVLAEVTRQLLGRCSPAQLFDVLSFEDRLAIERILKPFDHGLEVFHPRLERLHSMLPTGVGRSRARSPAVPTPPRPSTEPCVHSQDLPALWSVRRRARGRGNETRRANQAGPAGLDHCPQAPRLGTNALRRLSGSGLKSCPRSQLDRPRYSHFASDTIRCHE